MTWTLLVILGVPIWLVLGAFAAAFISRRTFQRAEGVFPLRLRESDDSKWDRMSHGRWVQNVLLVNKGFALIRTAAFGVESLSEPETGPEPIKGLGDDPVTFSLRTSDGSILLMATAAEHAGLATGPFPHHDRSQSIE